MLCTEAYSISSSLASDDRMFGSGLGLRGLGCPVPSAIRIRGLHLGGSLTEDNTSPQEAKHEQPYQSLEPIRIRRQKLTSARPPVRDFRLRQVVAGVWVNMTWLRVFVQRVAREAHPVI